MPWLSLAFKFRDVAYVLVIVAMFGLWKWEKAERLEDQLAMAKAVQDEKDKAAKLSDELVLEQAKVLAATNNKAVTYVDRIRVIKAPDTACPSDERMRIGSRGVLDIVGGSAGKAGSGPVNSVQPTPVGPRPR